MSELLVRVHDKVNPNDIYLDVKCLKRGDVVVVCPDGWGWSTLEQTNPDWRIVQAPDLPFAEAQTLLTPEVGDPKLNRMLRYRANKLDVDSLLLPTAIATWIADDGRVTPTLLTIASQIRAIKVLKTPLTDPNVIG